MTTEGWIFMVGFRVFDVGLLIVWLIWFFRLRDDDDDSRGDDGGGGEGPGPRPGKNGPGGDGIRLPLGRWQLGRGRVRDHSRPPLPDRRRGTEPAVPAPARVRRIRPPAPAHR
ncbi:MAG TPA: hypothetical protein VK307_08800 [Thermoleophilaceae bacterium]|nr:hypothetical protein [Thermoleophilaceae bacterium]